MSVLAPTALGACTGVLIGAPESACLDDECGHLDDPPADSPDAASADALDAGVVAARDASVVVDAEPPEPIVSDRFGVRMLYPLADDGQHWESQWDVAGAHDFGGVDPKDPWFDADHGSGALRVDSVGVLSITGRAPRMYIRDPKLQRQWRDVEITVYARRVSDGSVAHAGIVSVARSNHGSMTGKEDVQCDSRGLGARMRYDGHTDFEKETVHPHAAARSDRMQWRGGLPKDAWIGYKHVVYDLPDGTVKQELWLDTSGGVNGGSWQRVNENVDVGGTWGAKPCRAGVDPTLPLTGAPTRLGSESQKPNLMVYFRSDEVDEHGLQYKWASVREISAR